jgi:hypothetical protein
VHVLLITSWLMSSYKNVALEGAGLPALALGMHRLIGWI